MISRCIALFLASLLAGCCASGVGCNAPAAGDPVAWDGLGAPPVENAAAADSALRGSDQEKREKIRQIATHTDSTPQGSDKYEHEQAAGEAADAKLNQQLKICRNCNRDLAEFKVPGVTDS